MELILYACINDSRVPTKKHQFKKTSASLQVSITSGQREKIRKNNYGGLGDGMRCQKQ